MQIAVIPTTSTYAHKSEPALVNMCVYWIPFSFVICFIIKNLAIYLRVHSAQIHNKIYWGMESLYDS